MTTTKVEEPAAEPTAAQSEVDFAKAFAEAVAAPAEPATPAEPAAPAEPKPAEPKPAEPATPAEPKSPEPAPAEPKPAAPAASTPAVPKPAEAAPAAPVAPAAPAPVAPTAPAPAPAPEPEPKPFVIPDAEWSTADKQLYDEAKTSWPDVFAAFEKREAFIRRDLEVRTARALHKVLERVYADMGPIHDSVTKVEKNEFRAAVLKAHEDFDAVRPKLAVWIDTQAPYLRETFKRVHDEGSAEDVIDLVKRYKAENGVAPQPPTPVPPISPAPAAPAPAPDPKVQALAPVARARRSAPLEKGEDTQDFGTAFLEAVAEMTPK